MSENLQPRVFEASGKKWHVEINAWTLKLVRTMTGVEIGKWTGKDMFEKMAELFSDPEKFVDVLYVLCEDQCKERGMTDEDFGRSMAGASIEDAVDVFCGAFADFCPSQGREVVLKMLEKMKTFGNRATTLAMTEVDSLDVEKMIQSLTSKLSAKSSPESSASIPEG